MDEQKKHHIACIFGTRPELIKIAPVIFKLKDCSWAKVSMINTAQHRELLDDMLEIFGITPDLDLNIMQENQSLGELTANLCSKFHTFLANQHFDAILGVGDTTTVVVAALSAVYHKIPFGHIEAGLRTYDKSQPFPEEINRVLVAHLATWHFAPTETEKENLCKENISANSIFVTGNTVIDALYWTLANRNPGDLVKLDKNYIVVTAHRRENWGPNLENICRAILRLSELFPDIHFVLPTHPNPNVRKTINKLLAEQQGIHLISALKYDEFAHLMKNCLFIVTDSGGIQEEAPALHKPVLVLRDKTERPAILEKGVGLLAGTKEEDIVKEVSHLLMTPALYKKMATGPSPYGDGHAAEKIVAILHKLLLKSN